jgi:hypothetical protein
MGDSMERRLSNFSALTLSRMECDARASSWLPPAFISLLPVTTRFRGSYILNFTTPTRLEMRLRTTYVSTLMVLSVFGAPEANSPPEIAGLDFDIKQFATDAM